MKTQFIILSLIGFIIHGCSEYEDNPKTRSIASNIDNNWIYISDSPLRIVHHHTYDFGRVHTLPGGAGFQKWEIRLFCEQPSYDLNQSHISHPVYSVPLTIKLASNDHSFAGTYKFLGYPAGDNEFTFQRLENISSQESIFFQEVKDRKFIINANMASLRNPVRYNSGLNNLIEGWVKIDERNESFSMEFDLTFSEPYHERITGHYSLEN